MDPQHDDEEPEPDKQSRNTEFECPECNAHNPVDDGFVLGGEVTCYYCGVEFRVAEFNGRFKFKPA